jgi:hypothetical protein
MHNPSPASPEQEPGPPALPETRPMPSRGRRVALAVTATVFILWIAYLAFLAYTAGHPIVLSRPQILASNLLVIAQLSGDQHPETTATVLEIPWADNRAAQPQPKARVTVSNLDQVYAADANHPKGCWRGPGEYLLPLTAAGKNTFRVTPIPPSPGYSQAEADRLRIYPVTPSTREELQQILREYQRQ